MTESPPRAVLVGVQLPDVTDAEHESSLAELSRLAKTLGLDVIARLVQKRPGLSKASVVGEGKLREIASYTGGTGVIPRLPVKKEKKSALDSLDSANDEDEAEDESDSAAGAGEDGDGSPEASTRDPKAPKATVVLIDHDISPSQARNLERATGAEVLDRTAVILAIFHRHAKSREARLQVEIARIHYMAPRLRETGGGKDRQRGGIGGRGGAGESSMELDKRKVRDRIAEIRRELESIESTADTRRRARGELPTAALVGYTNAGKSSLMRALTGSEIYVADKLFATLDTTVRALQPETRPRILISDTVGFIKRLPHDLVASFRSTLAEAREAELLLHVVDAADPAFERQIEVTRSVLGEIGALEAPVMLLLNKVDRLPPERVAELAALHPDAVMLSAHRPEDVAMLRERIVAFFERGMVEDEILVPYDRQDLVSAIHDRCRVLSDSYGEDGARLTVRARPEQIAKIRAMLPEARRAS